MDINQITFEEIKNLNVSEKILIVEELWDSIVKDNEYPELTESQQRELNSRISYYHTNPQHGRTWEEIKTNFWASK